MQQIKTGFITSAWILGLLIAGSDSPQMPWVNFIGLFLFAAASMLLGRQLNQPDKKTDAAVYSGLTSRHSKVNRRMHARYGLGA